MDNAPQLLPGLAEVFAAFNELSTCRNIGLAVGPIPWTAIRQYAEFMGLDDLQFENFNFLIRSMDRAYMEWNTARAKKALEKPDSQPPGKRIGGNKP